MNRIKILPETIVGKISAGEVVERPASVVKELIENSIDAGANSISVYIKEFGIAEIKVIDDGEGIPSDDVILAFQRHATSKIKDEKDLQRISSLGFRGEALYSIANVSKLKIITQYKDEDTGTEVYLTGGNLVSQKPVVTKGTTVEIRDLFFNTPVRRKFLKSSYTEKAHIIETVQNYCLAYPEISFSLFIDREEVLNIPQVKTLYDRISQVFGLEFTEKLKFKTISKDNYKIELFLGGEELLRKSKGRQLIFVNRRPVKDFSIVNTIYKAFHINENHPQFFIFINLPPEDVDFNVHPAKKEVRFREPQIIHQLIFRMSEYQVKSSMIAEETNQWKVNADLSSISQISAFYTESIFNKEEIFHFFSIGDAIVVIQRVDGIVFLDFHAAHERVNFEKILNKMSEQIVKLTFPHVINLNPQDYVLIKENLHILNELGIEAEDFGENSIVIRALPEIIKYIDIAGMIENIALTLKEGTSTPDFIEIKRKIAATIACHSSLRANEKINHFEIKALLQELERTSDPEHCPHGRPVRKFISLDEIKKWFLR
ncbi:MULTISPECIES: DNA mismatch repair endonuclease MutL [Thermodesulfovibrio]|uniref:DNA mismatch repair protein MutL n=1 Tax=Thermodesulfovibrio yellowstonii (strain ATCC 51303 / DSM 11347 / YP87) TaxID=289376 RepID=MUTL_THEYD|nr:MULTISPECIES: DNA mismatch repair endonuclease MutL [Thermodesulfovibrio]B5YIZ6.1 RecName: Full=DNA mismatch repair protein MutL [Thermodesulfovibrio yellowstonii DSM 11347]ACI21459.1 DNA mismatch repair protein MutL [Thermodesulfovibrio yellowstonii DSM 11347]